MPTFADDPAEFFEFRVAASQRMPRAEAESRQLAALERRFADLREKIPPLRAMADAQGINAIRAIDDVAPLLFPHSFYKSYPSRALISGDFVTLTEWLSRLTVSDLSAVAGTSFRGIDAWLEALDQHTPLRVMHSSGTTGLLSFHPRSTVELDPQRKNVKMVLFECVDPDSRLDHRNETCLVVWPAFAHGRSGLLRIADHFREYLVTDERDFLALFDAEMSCDYQFYNMLVQNAAMEGRVNDTPATPHVRRQLDRIDAINRQYPACVSNLLDRVSAQARGRRTVLAGGPLALYQLAKDGLERGIEAVMSPESIIYTFGGTKGFAMPGDWESVVRRFTGARHVSTHYGMTELTAGLTLCERGRYHSQPCLIVFALDPATGAALPREGVQRGRVAFFDLIARTYWGGIVAADEVEIDHRPCDCGRTTPHLSPDITRIERPVDNEHRIGAASSEAIDAALASLSEGLD